MTSAVSDPFVRPPPFPRPQGPKPEFPELPADSMNTGNNTLSLAFDALNAGDYQHAFVLCNEAIDQGISEDWKVGRAEALNMRGTFRFLLGDSQGAKEDFEKSLDLVPDYVQSLVKVASVHMELGDAAGAFGDLRRRSVITRTIRTFTTTVVNVSFPGRSRAGSCRSWGSLFCLRRITVYETNPNENQSTLSPTSLKRPRRIMKSRRAWTTSLSFPTSSTPSLSTR